MSYSTYPIKLQLFQLMLPTSTSALKGLADLYLKNDDKKKERGQKSQCKRNERQPSPYSHIREVCYPQGAIVE